MEINCEGKLSEKRAKELKVSLNYILDNIIKNLREYPEDQSSFRISFDNIALANPYALT
jgi:hypothetical protein